MLGISQTVTKTIIKEKKLQPSGYQPDENLRKLYQSIRADLDRGRRTNQKPWLEFNNRTLEQEMNETQKAFNTWIPMRRTDPLHSWRAQTRRPILRNKLINTIAHATKATLIPGIYAYDEHTSEQDTIAAQAMKSIINWVVQNSDYAESFVDFTSQIVSQPAGILEVGFALAKRKIRNSDGKEEEVIDEELSGHYFETVPCNEFLIDNPYEKNIQRQRWIARRKLVSYDQAQALYGELANFQYVQPGVSNVIDVDSGVFYQIDDPELEGQFVEEIKYYNRSQDLEVLILNGVIIGNAFAGNPYGHKKYPFVKAVYEPINDGKFFWGKSQANKLLPDEDVINTLRNMFIDGTFLQLMPPFAVFGSEQPHQVVMVPGGMSAYEEEVKLQNVAPQSDVRAGLLAMNEIEKSMIETSVDPYRAGNPANLPDRMPAYNMAKLEENAEAQLGLLVGSMSRAITDVSELLVSNIIQYNTVGQLTSAIGPDVALKYPSFIVNNETEEGQDVKKRIMFEPEFFASANSAIDLSYKVLEREGLNNEEERIVILNPEPFRRLKFKAYVGTDTMQKKNSVIEKALKLEAYDRLKVDPIIASNARSMSNVTRDFLLGSIAPGKAARYMPDEESAPTIPVEEGSAPTQNITGQITGSNSLENMMAIQNDQESAV